MRVIKWEPFRDVDDIFDRFFAETLRRWPRAGNEARAAYDWAPVADISETDAEYVMVSLEDTWGEIQAQNIPGTATEQYPNWTNRAAHSLEEFDSVAGLTEALEAVRRLRGARVTAPASQSRIGG